MKIKELFDFKITEIAQASDQIDWNDKETYCKWMNQQYYLVQNSSRYLAFAASLVNVEKHDDFHWWLHHLREELDHDKTLLKDMKSLGWVQLEPIMPEIRAMVGSQYYDLQKHGPDSLLGYALLLEGLSTIRCAVIAEKVEKAHGGKSTYLRLHGAVDLDHYPAGIAAVEKFSLERQAVVIQNLEMMASLYLNFVRHMCAMKKAGIPKAA